MSEINKKNCFITKQIFDINNEYKLNIYNGDSLLLNISQVWDIEKFDIVIGNPPYQDSSGNKGKGHTLWDKFVKKFLNNDLKNNGYLVFVHPSLWRQIEHPLLELIKSKQIIYLEIHNVKDGLKTFQCSTRYDFYVIKNIKYHKNTIIKDEEGIINNIDLREWNFIPNMKFELLKNMCNHNIKCDIWRYRSLYSTENKKLVSKIQTNTFIYPLIYTINKNNQITFRYTNDNTKGIFNKSKFIFSNGAGFTCDPDGQYGLTEWAYCIYDNPENLDKIMKCFRNNNFKKIIDAIHLDSASYNIKIMKLFKKDFYEEFQEDNLIEDDDKSISSKSSSKSSSSTKSLTKPQKQLKEDVILCGFPLKKKGETCKNKANSECDGRCKRHFVLVV